ncbi:hypothetical protein [Streptomyces microflavus]|uniref:Uncharacterized protein n=1 Tax=Streptomyces microflavus TaxID=1919 RepID=A0ABV1Q7X1_STRMI
MRPPGGGEGVHVLGECRRHDRHGHLQEHLEVSFTIVCGWSPDQSCGWMALAPGESAGSRVTVKPGW